jgi:hypothetical protein
LLSANDAAYPDCANGGNQGGMPLNFWLYLPAQEKAKLCTDGSDK